MEFTHDGLTLWYGTDDAPAPEGTEEARRGVSFTIGVRPPSPNNTVAVRYRVDGWPIHTTPARLVHTDYPATKQYFLATFPDIQAGHRVEYLPILSCAGRQVPDVVTSGTFPSSFRLGAALGRQGLAVTQVGNGQQPTPQSRFPINPEYLCSVSVQLKTNPEIIGTTPEGIRVNWYADEGVATGPKLNAKVRPGAADWMIIRPDGIGVVDIRATLETYDGALIYASESGVFDLGENGYQNFLDEKWPDTPPLRSAPRFITAHASYQWLNRLQCLAVGQVQMADLRVEYDVYAVR